MNKAQLIIDMPETCIDCCFYQAGEPSWCDLYVTNYRDIENENIRQEWCPLKPLPNKISHSEIDDPFNSNFEDEYDYWTIEGYNQCLKEITGEEYEIL